MTLGMRRVIVAAHGTQLGLTVLTLGLHSVGVLPPDVEFALHILWMVGLFAMMSLTMGNLSALAMEPVGHVAGLAASVILSLATVGAVIVAVPVGQAFAGTSGPVLAGVAVLLGLALLGGRFGLGRI